MKGGHLPRISSIRFDQEEMPVHATIRTSLGVVRVEWRDVCGDRYWFTSGTGDAKREAVPTIERIELMCQSMH